MRLLSVSILLKSLQNLNPYFVRFHLRKSKTYPDGPFHIEFSCIYYGANGANIIYQEETLSLGTGWHFFPALSVDGSGRLTLSYVQCNNPDDVNPLINIYMVESLNRAYDWIEETINPILITSTSSNPKNSYYSQFTHHYQGLLSKIGTTIPLWADYRNTGTKSDIYTALYNSIPTSGSMKATAYNSVRKMVYANSRWHSVIYSNKDLYHIMSTNDGASWYGYEKMDGTTATTELRLDDNCNPSLFTYNNKLHTVFNQQEGLYYNRATLTGTWEEPKLLYYTTTPAISSFIDANGIGHVVWIEGDMAKKSLITYKLNYGTFNTADANPSLSGISTINSSSGTYYSPAIMTDSQGRPHVTWMKGNKIWHSMKTTGWSTAYEVSDGLTASETPSMHILGTIAYITWKNGNPGEIWTRTRNSNGSWAVKINTSQSATYASENPFISEVAGEPMVMWSEDYTTVKYCFPMSMQSGTMETSDQAMQHPTYSYRPSSGTAKVVCLWTEKESLPYLVKSAYKNMFPMLGKSAITEIVTLPDKYSLHPNYPNPFNPSTRISFDLPKNEKVNIVIYDILGHEVTTLVDHFFEAGNYSVTWDGKNSYGQDVATGVYIVKLTAGKYKKTGKMILMK